MAIPEIARRYVGGGWRTNVENEGPSGGSQATVVEVTFTAAEIAATWNGGDGAAALPLPQISDDGWVFGWWESANDLDQNVTVSNLAAYDPDASTDDVYNNGDNFSQAIASSSAGTYANEADFPTAGGTGANKVQVFWLVTGKAAYAIFGGDAAPTTGSSTIILFRG